MTDTLKIAAAVVAVAIVTCVTLMLLQGAAP